MAPSAINEVARVGRSYAGAIVRNERGLRRGLLTAPLRLAPRFLIIGARKGGTTALYVYLCQHPLIETAARVEVNYFDLKYEKPWWWYKAHFPPRWAAKAAGEATPNYLRHPMAPERVRRRLPGVRLIALLRDPVDRAYSQYQHVRRQGNEGLSFEEAVEREPERTQREIEMNGGPECASSIPRRYNYASGGYYAEQLARWFELFPLEQILVLRSEDFFSDPAFVCARVFDHLGLPHYEAPEYPVYNSGNYQSTMSVDMRRRLTEHFEPHNRRLERMLGWDSSWGEIPSSRSGRSSARRPR